MGRGWKGEALENEGTVMVTPISVPPYAVWARNHFSTLWNSRSEAKYSSPFWFSGARRSTLLCFAEVKVR